MSIIGTVKLKEGNKHARPPKAFKLVIEEGENRIVLTDFIIANTPTSAIVCAKVCGAPVMIAEFKGSQFVNLPKPSAPVAEQAPVAETLPAPETKLTGRRKRNAQKRAAVDAPKAEVVQ